MSKKNKVKIEEVKVDTSRIPVQYGLVGEHFCSPLCGLDCLKEDYDKAVAESQELVKQLGPHWSPIVWENYGWHYKVKLGPIEVLPNRGILLGHIATFQILPYHNYLKYGDTIQNAIKNVLEEVNDSNNRLLDSLKFIDGKTSESVEPK